ncbi:MAG TPA: hypothetical protein VFO34_03150 [Candidatus Acidoferrales bacterium]|nr:hypothetical protein [Candidatus Acidoferrales bacterium]
MKKWLSVFGVAAIFAAAPLAFAQGQGNGQGQSKDDLPIQIPYGTHLTQKHAHGQIGEELNTSGNDSKSGNSSKGHPGGGGGGGGSTPLQTWSATVQSPIDGNFYTYTMVGQNPATSNTSTPIATYLIPVRLNFQYRTTTYSFDPTVSDPSCLGGSNDAFDLTKASPIFQPSDYNLGGTPVGTAQYVDAFQRANFWSEVSVNTLYGTELALLTTKPLQTVTVSSGNTGLVNGTVYVLSGTQCGSSTGNTNHAGYIGVANINSIDSAVHSLITQLGIPSNAFPIFLLYNAVMSEGSPTNLGNCCVLGYHGVTSTGQTYGVAEFEGRDNTAFSGVADITALSHEVAEWMDDPLGNNPTPAWGHVGQVSNCQGNLEVGDPLSGTQFPAINMGGFTYHPQELAFASWFYRFAPSGSVNGWYSNNNTFTQDAGAVCH